MSNNGHPPSLDQILEAAFRTLDEALRKDPAEFMQTTQPALMQLGRAITLLRNQLGETSEMITRSNMMVAAVLRCLPGMQIVIPEGVLVEVDKEDLIQTAQDAQGHLHLKLTPKEVPSKIIVPRMKPPKL